MRISSKWEFKHQITSASGILELQWNLLQKKNTPFFVDQVGYIWKIDPTHDQVLRRYAAKCDCYGSLCDLARKGNSLHHWVADLGWIPMGRAAEREWLWAYHCSQQILRCSPGKLVKFLQSWNALRIFQKCTLDYWKPWNVGETLNHLYQLQDVFPSSASLKSRISTSNYSGSQGFLGSETETGKGQNHHQAKSIEKLVIQKPYRDTSGWTIRY